MTTFPKSKLPWITLEKWKASLDPSVIGCMTAKLKTNSPEEDSTGQEEKLSEDAALSIPWYIFVEIPRTMRIGDES